MLIHKLSPQRFVLPCLPSNSFSSLSFHSCSPSQARRSVSRPGIQRFPRIHNKHVMFHHVECQTKCPIHKRFRVASVVQDVVCGSFSSTCPSATGMVTSQRSERLLSLHVWGSMCCFSNAETTWNNCHKRQIGVLGVVSPRFNWCTWYWQSLGHLSYLGSLSADGVMDSHDVFLRSSPSKEESLDPCWKGLCSKPSASRCWICLW